MRTWLSDEIMWMSDCLWLHCGQSLMARYNLLSERIDMKIIGNFENVVIGPFPYTLSEEEQQLNIEMQEQEDSQAGKKGDE